MKTAVRLFFIMVILIISIGKAYAQNEGYESITSSNLLKTVDTLCSKDFNGRLPGSEGYNKAADFAAEKFTEAGLIPYFNNSYFQYIDLPDQRDLNMRTMYLMGGAIFSLNDHIEFQPVLLASYNRNAPFDLDINLGFSFFDALFAGLTYRLDDSADLLVAYQITKQFRLGAAYDFTMSELSQKTTGSFEIMAQYRFMYDDLGIRNLRFF